MSNSLISLSVAQLKRAVAIKEHIEALELELTSVFGSASDIVHYAAEPAPVAGAKRHKRSAITRARMAAAQKARWARVKAADVGSDTPKKRRKLTAAGRRRLGALAKARWAKARAAGRHTL